MTFQTTAPLLAAIILLIAILGLALWWGLRRLRKPVVIVDGSNVMHWESGSGPARLALVRDVAAQLRNGGLRPVIWFDANAGYKISDRYMPAHVLARFLHLSQRDVHVAPKGTPADPLLLEMARALNAHVVSNDRFRDWAEAFPDVLSDGRVIGGDVRDGRVQLNLDGGERS